MNKDKAIASVIFLFSFVVYLLTLCPTIAWQDSAAFSACHCILGIPHSPSFPIYILIGRLFNLIPLSEPAWRSNMMSGFFGSLSLALLYLVIMKIFAHSGTRDDSKVYCRGRIHSTREAGLINQAPTAVGRAPSPARGFFRSLLSTPQNIIRFSSFFGVLSLGFASGFWLQTTRAEVYTLNIFFTLFILYLIIQWSDKVKLNRNVSFKLLALATLVYGISLTNHSLLMATLLPAFLVFILIVDSKSILSFKRITPLLLLFLIGVTIYLFLLIRSQQEPLINWRRPNNLVRLIEVITRAKSLSHSIKNFAAPYETRLSFCLSFIVYQFSLFFFPLGIIGAVRSLRFNKRIWALLMLIFGLNLLTATWATDFSLKNYDIQAYLLPALAVFSIWISFGFYFVIVLLKKIVKHKLKLLKSTAIAIIILALIFLPFFQLIRNFKECDKSQMVWAHELGLDALKSIEEGAIFFPGELRMLDVLWYLSYCQEIKPNINLLPVVALHQKDYFNFLKKKYPELEMPPLKEYNVLYQRDRNELISALSERNVDRIPIYYQYRHRGDEYPKHLMPRGYVFEYLKEPVMLDDSIIEAHWDFFKQRFSPEKIEKFDLMTRDYLSRYVFKIGWYYQDRGNFSVAYRYFSLALQIDPTNTVAYSNISRSLMERGELEMASRFLEALVKLEPDKSDNYLLLATCYFELDEYEKSRMLLNKGLKVDPDNRKLIKILEEFDTMVEKRSNYEQ